MKPIEQIKEYPDIWNVTEFVTGVYDAQIKLPDCGRCSVVFGYNEDGYEHVSVNPFKKFDKLGRDNLPTWNDMVALKDIFFCPDEEVYQIHPPHKEYVNIVERCLHLWRPVNGRKLDEIVRTEDENNENSER